MSHHECQNLIFLSNATKVYPEEFKEGRVSVEVAKNKVCHRWIPKTSQVLTPGLVMAAAGQRFVYVSGRSPRKHSGKVPTKLVAWNKFMWCFFAGILIFRRKHTQSLHLTCSAILVGGFKHVLFSISYMGCHPSHWRTPSIFKMVIAPPTRLSLNHH